MKKSCKECKAFKGKDGCGLGYKIEIERNLMPQFGYESIYRGKPLEQCPKPKNNIDYIYLKRWIKK